LPLIREDQAEPRENVALLQPTRAARAQGPHHGFGSWHLLRGDGRFDAHIELGISLWDIAAGGLIVECAGGSSVRTHLRSSPILHGGEQRFDPSPARDLR
jgi:hypothetical protein